MVDPRKHEEIVRLVRESREAVRRSREFIEEFRRAAGLLRPERSLAMEAVVEAHQVLEKDGRVDGEASGRQAGAPGASGAV